MQLAKLVKEHGEKTNIAVRNIRRDANKQADSEKKDKVLTEDDCDRVKKDIQDLTKKYEGKVGDFVSKKTADLMEV